MPGLVIPLSRVICYSIIPYLAAKGLEVAGVEVFG